jgi:hypothetical protein
VAVSSPVDKEDGVEIRRSVLVPYSAEAMFDLIEQAEWYPSFLPWCTAAEVLERATTGSPPVSSSLSEPALRDAHPQSQAPT